VNASAGPGPVCGKMTWPEAAAGPLSGATCLWQDLDGLHVEPAPAQPPPASLIWAWRGHDHLVRLRLDGGTAYVAVHQPSAEPPGATAAGSATGAAAYPRRTLAWAEADLRVAARRGPSAAHGGPGAAYEQIVVDGITDGAGPITFLRPVVGPAGPSSPGQHA
jgi:hypothetical protein